jgi:pimeloyl-ACP methyl ester carboxylesterase
MAPGQDARMPSLTSADGTAIAFETGGAGPGLVLVHGSGTSRVLWQPVRASFEAKRHVMAMDRRGHGESGDAPDYALAREGEDIAALLAAHPGAMLGHSYGGLGVLAAVAQGARPTALLLYEPPIPASRYAYFPPSLIPAMRAAAAAGDAEGVLVAFLAQVHGMGPEQIARMQAMPGWAARVALAPVLLREIGVVDDYAVRLIPGWDIPTLLLVGEASPPQYHATAGLLAAALPGARIALLPGQGHGAVSAAPEMFAEVVLAFLEDAGA